MILSIGVELHRGVIPMFNWLPWNSRKKRTALDWERVETAKKAMATEHVAAVALAEMTTLAGVERKEAYANVLAEYVNRKRGLHG